MSTQHGPTANQLAPQFISEPTGSGSDPWIAGSSNAKAAVWPSQNQPTPTSGDWSSSWTQKSAQDATLMKLKEMSGLNNASQAASGAGWDDSFFFHIRPGQRLQSWDQFVVHPQMSKKGGHGDYPISKVEPSVLQVIPEPAGGEEVPTPTFSEKVPWTVVPSGAPVPSLASPITPPVSTPSSPIKSSPPGSKAPVSPSQPESAADAAAAAAAAAALSRRNSEIEQELQQQSLYKTELCRSWAETGACRYGTKCQFAHGVEELRPVMRHPKYKTEICRTFHTLGTCPYGTRCRFIHNRDGVLPPEWSTEIQRARSMSQPFLPSPNQSSAQLPVQTGSPSNASMQRSTSVDYSAIVPAPAPADLVTQRFSQMNISPMSWEVPPAVPAQRASLPAVPVTEPPVVEEEKDRKSGKRKPRLPFFERLTVKKKDKESSSKSK